MTKILCSIILLLSLSVAFGTIQISLSNFVHRQFSGDVVSLFPSSLIILFLSPLMRFLPPLAFRENPLQFFFILYFLSLFPFLLPSSLSLSLSIRPWQVVCHSSASYFSQQSLTQRNLREFIHTHTHTHNMDQKTRLYMICITYNLRKCISSHKLNNLTCENDLQILSPHLTFSQYLCLIFQCLLDFTI